MYIFHIDLAKQSTIAQKQVYALAAEQKTMFDSGLAQYKPLVLCVKNTLLHNLLMNSELEFWVLPTAKLNSPNLYYSIRKAIKIYNPVLFNSHGENSAYLAYFARKYFSKQAKLVHTRRSSVIIRRGKEAKKYLESDALVCVNKEIADLAKEMFIPEKIIQVIYSGVDPKQYTPKIYRTDQRFVFVAVGALVKEKGYDILLEAMKIIDKIYISSLPKWEVRILGSGDLFSQILTQAEEFEIDAKLALLGEQESNDVLPFCDAYISAAVESGDNSIGIKEAFAVGLPIICTDLESNKELVNDKINGLIVKKANAEALAGAMLTLMQDEQLAKSLVTNSKTQLELFTVQKMSENYNLLYEKLLAK